MNVGLVAIVASGQVILNIIKIMTLNEKIYKIVSKIPYGKVATYGQIATLCGNPYYARAVGNALHKNPNPQKIPCYRVVNSKGKLTENFAFGGLRVQSDLLISEGKFVLCKHKRDTLEFPGGHREAEEFIVDTAERELKEETGAKDFTLEPVCIYGVKEGDGDETYGMLCVADITSFEPFDSEIEKIVITDTLPDNWTYPTIQPYLLKELNRRNLI